jgi:type II secretory ATPase GspE/PulE/Tfp pilus assembly ATPase PilB-like protein
VHPPNLKEHAATVTVALTNGHLHGGYVSGFDPSAPEIALASSADAAQATRRMIPSSSVAYLAFHRAPGERNTLRGRPVRVTLQGGVSFRVRGWTSDDTGTGFFALPDDAKSPFRLFFFFRRAVRRLERAEPLGELLVARGSVPPEAVEQAVVTQVEARAATLGAAANVPGEDSSASPDGDSPHEVQHTRIGEILLAMGSLTEEDLARALAAKFHLPFVDLDHERIDPRAASLLPRSLIERSSILPIASDDRTLTVAIADPLAVDALDEAAIYANRRLREVVASPSQIARHSARVLASLDASPVNTRGDERLLHKTSARPQSLPPPPAQHPEATTRLSLKPSLAAPPSQSLKPAQVPTPRDARPPPRIVEGDEPQSDTDVVALVDHLLLDAVRRGASDIHIEPVGPERPTLIRLRIDGDCVRYRELPGPLGAQLVARLKIMASLDIAERRRPQDGKLQLRTPERTVEFRIATIPTVDRNEDAVLRILADSKPLPLDAVGLSPRNLAALQSCIKRPYGLILCVGPTGSGKTTTLHAMLGHINTPDMKIWTAEDPVEITQPGLRQVQVQPKAGVTFATALRSFLRADPDVIMVGEMRDEETAAIAVEASLTGHLVLSTLHTNSAAETVIRLLDMGLNPSSFSAALLGVLAQRLVRTLCPRCKAPVPGDREVWERHASAYGEAAFDAQHPFGEGFVVWKAVGCEACGGSGYKGRIAIHEFLLCDDEVRRAIARRQPLEAIEAHGVRGGMRTLVQDGIDKALAGHTDLAQVLAVAAR